jgi:predicted nuclease of predicted toxin-antitoxin system
MKLLFDQNLSFRLCKDVVDLFPESSHVRLLGLSEATDHTLWDYAKRHTLRLFLKMPISPRWQFYCVHRPK